MELTEAQLEAMLEESALAERQRIASEIENTVVEMPDGRRLPQMWWKRSELLKLVGESK